METPARRANLRTKKEGGASADFIDAKMEKGRRGTNRRRPHEARQAATTQAYGSDGPAPPPYLFEFGGYGSKPE